MPKSTTPKVDQNVHIELMKELYRSFDFFNKKFAGGKLRRPVITIATRGTHKAMGWFCNNIWSVKDKAVHEINICGEALAEGIEQTMDTLLHEMAHLKNFDAGIEDCTDQQRHNAHFKASAEAFGLSVTSSKRFGPAHTALTAETKAIIKGELKPDTVVFTMYRKAFNAIKKDKDKKDKGPKKLTPLMIDKETKEVVEAGAKELGCDMKNLTEMAVKFYLHMQKNKPKSIPQEFRITKK